MTKSKIEWTDATWNPVTGCTKISDGCKNCYAERMSKRLAGRCGYPKDDPFAVTVHKDKRFEPLHWRKARRVFVCSMGDLFHSSVSLLELDVLFGVMNGSRQHIFQVLTKRPGNMARFLNNRGFKHFPLMNVWLGTTVENSDNTSRINQLRKCPAAVRFLSCEPLLGPLPNLNLDGIHWVIVGGESGPGARPMHPDWARDIRNQCEAASVPFFFKQWGGVRKKAAGRLLDGREWNEMPERSD